MVAHVKSCERCEAMLETNSAFIGTPYDRRLASTGDEEQIRRAGAGVVVRNHLRAEDMTSLLPRAADVIGQLATPEVVQRVAAKNGDAVWTFSRAGKSEAAGFLSVLLLNEPGLAALLDGSLDLLDPPDAMLVAQSERPAAIYVWATFTPGRMALGIPTVFDHFTAPRYAQCDIYSTSNTLRGARSMERLGFEQGVFDQGINRPDLYICRRNPRSIAASRPRYDSYIPALGCGIHVANGLDDFLKVAAIRSAVYIGEQSCPFAEEFDGNDQVATHLIGWRDHEPAGCMRIRFFGGFAKLERLAVRREFRKSSLAFDLVRASVELCRAKGVRQLYGHAREDLLPFWQRFGFKLRKNGAPFAFSDHVFLEMEDELEPDTTAISIDSGPYTIIRPEGRWHEPGILEASAERQGG